MFMENLKIFFENHAENEPGRLVPDLFLFSKKALFKGRSKPVQLSSNITFLARWMKCWNGLRNYKIYEVAKKKKKIMLNDVG